MKTLEASHGNNEIYSGIPDFALRPIEGIKPIDVDGREILEYGFSLGQGMRKFHRATEGEFERITFESDNSKYELKGINEKTAKGFIDWLDGAVQISENGPKVAAILGGGGAIYYGYKTLPLTTRKEFLHNGLKILKMGALGVLGGFLAGCTAQEAMAQIAATLGLEGTSEAVTATAIANGQIKPTETPQVFQTATGFVQVSQTPEGQITINSSPTPTLIPTETSSPTLTITPTATEILVPSWEFSSPQTTLNENTQLEWNPNLWFHKHINPPEVGEIELQKDPQIGDILHYNVISELDRGAPFWNQMVLMGPTIRPPLEIEIPICINDLYYQGNLLTVWNDTSFFNESVKKGTELENVESILFAIDLENYMPRLVAHPAYWKYGTTDVVRSRKKLVPEQWNLFKIKLDETGTARFILSDEEIGSVNVNQIPPDVNSDPDLNGGIGIRGVHGGEHSSDLKPGATVDNGPIKITSFA